MKPNKALFRMIFLTLIMGLLFKTVSAQTFYFGNDLSYVNQMEDCGAIYKEGQVPKDVYQIYADHGTNLIRVRLWNNPVWQNDLEQPAGVKAQYSDFEDVQETIRRAKQAGMQVMLDLHLSDFWADPGKQIIPGGWVAVATDTAALADSVYNYVVRILTQLDQDTLMPEIVKVGNENNGGILRHTTLNSDYTAGGSVSSSWARHSHFYKAAISAVRDAGASSDIQPRICLHYAGLDWIESWYQRLIDYGVTDFDIIGFSYYYAWHGASIGELGNTIRSLRSGFPAYDVMVAETGYPWTTRDFDALGNIATEPDPAYLPVIPEKQLEYLVDYTREVMNAGGIGVIFWESAWVSTPCSTAWGQGSSHDHMVFFDPVNTNFMENGGGKWTEARFYENPDFKKITFKVNTKGLDNQEKMYITGTMTGEPWKILPMYAEGPDLFAYTSYLAPGDSGAFYFLSDSSWSARETVPVECASWWDTDRGYKMGLNDTILGFTWSSCSGLDVPPEVEVTFQVDMTGEDVSKGVWVTGSMTGVSWAIIPMDLLGDNIYSKTFLMHPGDSGAYYFMNDDQWGSREVVPAECASWWGSDRGYKIGDKDTSYAFTWGTCLPPGAVAIYDLREEPEIRIYPNPSDGTILQLEITGIPGGTIQVLDISGRVVLTDRIKQPDRMAIPVSLTPGTYIVQVGNRKKLVHSLFIVH